MLWKFWCKKEEKKGHVDMNTDLGVNLNKPK